MKPHRSLVSVLFLLFACSSNVVTSGGASDDSNNNADGGAIDGGGTTDPNPYPEAPARGYGFQFQKVLPNLDFNGYLNVDLAQPIVSKAAYRAINLQDLRKTSAKYFYIDVSALWCPACRTQAPRLEQAATDWWPKGGLALTVIVQGNDRSSTTPATRDDLDSWVDNFKIKLVGLADSQQNFAGRNGIETAALPYNAVVRADTMQIVDAWYGYDQDRIDAFATTYLK